MTETPRPIAPGVWRVGGGSWNARIEAISAEADGNVYLLVDEETHVLVDCGTRAGLAMIRANLSFLGVDAGKIGDLLLTHSHWDHTGAAARWQADGSALRTHLNSVGRAFLDRGDHRLVGYQIIAPPHIFDAFRVDHGVDDEETFQLGDLAVTAHHLPGHTPDSTLYTVRTDGITLGFCGDIVFRPRPDAGPVLGQLCSLWLSNLDDYVESFSRMLDIPIDLLLPGHGEAVHGQDHVRSAIEQALELADELARNRRARENVGV
jgi:glyoxylase-like metal-dependent hydrolase (beta-lactamase superfamily II)